MRLLVVVGTVLLSLRAGAAPACNNTNVKVVAKKFPESTVIAAITKRSDCTFDTSEAGLADLRRAGVSEGIITVMLEKAATQALDGVPPAPQQTAASAGLAADALGSIRLIVGKAYALNPLPLSPEMGSGIGTMMTGGGLFRKIKQNFVVPGGTSETAVATAEGLYVLVNTANASAASIRLVRLTQYKGRRIVYRKEGKINISDTVLDEINVSFEASPEGLKLVPKEALRPGQYGIINVHSLSQAWTFDVGSR